MRAVEMEVRVVELVRTRGVAGEEIAVWRQVVYQPNLQGFARLHAQRRPQRAFVSAQVEAHAADVAIGVGASQAGAEHTVRRAADLGLDQGLVHRRHNRQGRHADFGHVSVRAAGLPQRSAPAQCHVPIAKPACSKPRREACGPTPRLVLKNLCSLAMISLRVKRPAPIR
jgi:hypothetical protein